MKHCTLLAPRHTDFYLLNKMTVEWTRLVDTKELDNFLQNFWITKELINHTNSTRAINKKKTIFTIYNLISNDLKLLFSELPSSGTDEEVENYLIKEVYTEERYISNLWFSKKVPLQYIGKRFLIDIDKAKTIYDLSDEDIRRIIIDKLKRYLPEFSTQNISLKTLRKKIESELGIYVEAKNKNFKSKYFQNLV